MYITKQHETKYWVTADKWFCNSLYINWNNVYGNIELKIEEDKEALTTCRFSFDLTDDDFNWNLKTLIANKIIETQLEEEMWTEDKIDFTDWVII